MTTAAYITAHLSRPVCDVSHSLCAVRGDDGEAEEALRSITPRGSRTRHGAIDTGGDAHLVRLRGGRGRHAAARTGAGDSAHLCARRSRAVLSRCERDLVDRRSAQGRLWQISGARARVTRRSAAVAAAARAWVAPRPVGQPSARRSPAIRLVCASLCCCHWLRAQPAAAVRGTEGSGDARWRLSGVAAAASAPRHRRRRSALPAALADTGPTRLPSALTGPTQLPPALTLTEAMRQQRRRGRRGRRRGRRSRTRGGRGGGLRFALVSRLGFSFRGPRRGRRCCLPYEPSLSRAHACSRAARRVDRRRRRRRRATGPADGE